MCVWACVRKVRATSPLLHGLRALAWEFLRFFLVRARGLLTMDI